MPKSFDIWFKHPNSTQSFNVTVALDQAPADADELIEVVRKSYPEARRDAAIQHLSELMGPDAGKPNLGAIAITSGQMTVDQVSFDGKTERYSVGGEYNEEGSWLDWVDATDPVDAEFQAKWQMSVNEGADPVDFDALLTNMSGIEITTCWPEPVTKDEYKAALLALVEEARAAGHSGPALDAAVEKLTSDSVEIEEAPGMRP